MAGRKILTLLTVVRIHLREFCYVKKFGKWMRTTGLQRLLWFEREPAEGGVRLQEKIFSKQSNIVPFNAGEKANPSPGVLLCKKIGKWMRTTSL